jgi:hypothetical protein
MNVEICRWKHGRLFAYSVTYDEGFVELLDYALPIHQKYKVPGHLVMVAGQLGQMRDVPSSTYHNLRRHLSAGQLRDLIQLGWSVGNHSMTHGDLNRDTHTEVVTANRVLEDAIGRPVTMFHLPGADFSFAPVARYLDEAGILAVFFTDDRINHHAPDLLGLSRTLMYIVEGEPLCSLYDPFPRVYDPYHRLHEALAGGGWIVDYTHSVEPQPLAQWKDATPDVLEARFDCLRRVGNGQEWAAEPEEIVNYILTREAASVASATAKAGYFSFRLHLGYTPARVKCHEISARVEFDAMPARPPVVLIDGQSTATIDKLTNTHLVFTWEARDAQLVELRWQD